MLNCYGAFGEIFGENFEKLAEIIRGLMYDFQAIEVKIKKRIKYKPILKISPNKIYIRDKRNANHYCRNNC